MKREPLETEEFFLAQIHKRERALESAEDEIKTKSQLNSSFNYNTAYLFLFDDNLKQFIAKYSVGYSMRNLEEQFNEVVKSLNRYTSNRPIDIPVDYLGQLGVGKYTEALFLISIALLLKVNDTVLDTLVQCLNIKGRDALHDKLISNRVQLETISSKINYPQVYKPLFDVIDAPKEKQAILMEKFLKGWYKSMKNAPWYDRHKKSWGFTGYWAWEAAGVAYAFNIDDSSFRDMPFYPKDLVDYARNH